MGFLIICICFIAISITMFILRLFDKINFSDELLTIIISFSLVIGIVFIYTSFNLPIGKFKDATLISTENIEPYEVSGNARYYIDSEGFVTFFITDEINPRTVTKSDVEIIKVKDCKMPRVEEYLMKWESSGWTYAREKDKTVYKIYIPE